MPRPIPAADWERAVKARHAILVDPATGAVLWGRRSRTSAAPASLTKMLTALTVRASLDLDAVTVASAEAARQPARRLATKRGQALAVDQALKALMIVSANDVAVMLAETAGGSVARFARAMDAESERLGLRGSSWRNPNGLDAPATARPRSTWPSWPGPCSRTAGWPGSWSATIPPSPVRWPRPGWPGSGRRPDPVRSAQRPGGPGRTASAWPPPGPSPPSWPRSRSPSTDSASGLDSRAQVIEHMFDQWGLGTHRNAQRGGAGGC
jgi:hypothetical protein